MELKNALAVCLISMFSATLVLLIARALDIHAASRLEPQLVRIVEQLEAIRTQGGVSIDASAPQGAEALDNGLVAYYFHGNVRCVTCRSIESQSHRVVRETFAPELADGRLVWTTLNYEEPDGSDLGKQFEIQVPVVVLAHMSNGQLKEWRRLDRVWALVNDQEAFAEYVEAEVREMLALAEPESDTDQNAADSTELGDDADDIPVPDAADDIPLPE
jgi:hypothetical protein